MNDLPEKSPPSLMVLGVLKWDPATVGMAPKHPNVQPIVVPVERRKVYVAPARNGLPLAAPWKFWLHGDEVYATCRLGSHARKISVHRSGQIHIRLTGSPEILSRPQLLGDGPWQH